MWSVHVMGYYLAKKSNEILIHATSWVNLKNITLSEEARHILYDLIYRKRPE